MNGLSTSHISTQKKVSEVISHGIFYCGASKLKVSRNFETYSNINPTKRNNISGFSYNSRRRLMDKLSRIDKVKVPLFITLTFADEHINMLPRHKGLLKAFFMRLHRAYGSAGWIWRLEFVDRKSGVNFGKSFPHYHILAWGVNSSEGDFRAWVAINWFEVCGSITPKHLAAGTSVERIRDQKGVFIYASKYLGKTTDKAAINQPGRYWGVVYVENIPFVKGILCQLREEEAQTLIRYMRRYAKINGHDFKSLSIFCNVDFWYDNLEKIVYGNRSKIINKSIDKSIKL